MQKNFLRVAVALVACCLIAISASAQQRWAIATSSTGSGPYIIGSAIANAVNGNTDSLAVSEQTSGGYNNNLVLVSGKRANSGLTFLPDLVEAHKSVGGFATMPKGDLRQAAADVSSDSDHCLLRSAG